MRDPKYSKVEFERRFLVLTDEWKASVKVSPKLICDKYLAGTRLRLRAVENAESLTFKLCKKYDSDSHLYQNIVNTYLSKREFDILMELPGRLISKRRYLYNFKEHVFALDEFLGELEGLVLCEFEADSLQRLLDVAVPPYVHSEVTEDIFFTGGNLNGSMKSELLAKIEQCRATDQVIR